MPMTPKMMEMARRSWAKRGEDNPQRKLTEEQVRDIRRRYHQDPEKRGVRATLAREYGVSHTLITFIVQRRMWKHLP